MSAAGPEAILGALAQGQLIDITTSGRRSGTPRRIEIVAHVIDGRVYISGRPSERPRDWLLNLAANPHLTIHLKQALRADVPATARVIADEPERRVVLAHIARAWGRDDLEAMVRQSPLIEVTLDSTGA